MRNFFLVAAVGLTALGCSEASPPPPPPFTDTTGEARRGVAYAPPPYGVGVGSTVADYALLGYADPSANAATTQAITLADFYNPHARDATYQPAAGAPDDRLFPEGSGYVAAGRLKPTALLIDVASVWCQPCREEGQRVLPIKRAEYAPCGGEIMLDLHDGATADTPATLAELQGWTSEDHVDYPSVIDPSYQLDALFEAYAFPNNLVIDTTTMKIVEVFDGEVFAGSCNQLFSCESDADCALCLDAGTCAGGKACSVDADCATETCTPDPFWTAYEALLDKSRSGCALP